jgi:hypothetical protein
MHIFGIGENGSLETQEIEETVRCTFCALPVVMNHEKRRFVVISHKDRARRLAIYCSMQCSLLHHDTMLRWFKRGTERSFGFLLKRNPDEVRLLRVLGELKKASRELARRRTHLIIN